MFSRVFPCYHFFRVFYKFPQKLFLLFVLSRAITRKILLTFSVVNNTRSCKTDYNPVVGLPYVVTNELEQLLRSACGEDAAQALVSILIFSDNLILDRILKI